MFILRNNDTSVHIILMLQLVDHGTHVGQDDDDDEDDDRHPQQQHHAEVEDHGEDDHRQYRATCQQELSSAQTQAFVLGAH